mgnify:CR=1 FL=1
MAAYNAGPHRVEQWIQHKGHLPLDEFIEEIEAITFNTFTLDEAARASVVKQLAMGAVATLSPMAAIVGGIVGTYALVSFSETPLVVALIAVVAIYVITFIRMPDFRISPAASRQAAPGVGLATGLLQGAIGISGPLIGSWIHCYRLERRAHIFSITTLFALAGAAQLVALLIAGELSGRWTVAALGCLPALATVPFGEHLRNRFSSEGFDRFVVTTIAVTVTALAIRTFA